jgi:hypothetical protein
MFLYSYFTNYNIPKDIIDIIIDYSRPTKYGEINNYLLLINNDEYNRWIRFITLINEQEQYIRMLGT